MAKDVVVDKELQQYRNLLDTPDKFEDGFGWTTIIGICFCGLVMMPGSIYLGLMTGGNIGAAASWVTVILFGEVSRRALRTMSKGNLVVLLHAANIMMASNVLFPGGPFGHIIYRAYMTTSEAVRDAGMSTAFPSWFCPPPDSTAITERNLFHMDWAIPIALAGFCSVIGLIKRYTLGYFFFRLCSDVERLPYPMAPIQAQGAMALAEADDKKKKEEVKYIEEDGKKFPVFGRWRLFSLGAVIGIAFGMIQVGVPALTGLFLDKPVFIIPQPYIDTTTLTESVLPATPTGCVFTLGIVIIGFVMPFWSIMGTFAAILLTLILNPILYKMGVLSQWQPGMNTVNTTFVNSIDFWMSFGIGAALAIAIVSIYATVKDSIKSYREFKKAKDTGSEFDDGRSERERLCGSLWQTPKLGRGDYPIWIALIGYIIAATTMVVVTNMLVPGLLFFLIIFSFIYNPFISYVNARLMGITGQRVEIPFIKEGAFILSGSKGVDIWLAPIPIENFGQQAQSFRVNELTGVSFWSLLKCDLVAIPILFMLSFMFWAFIWKSDAIPSDIFPAAQLNWELAAKNNALLYSSTFIPKGERPEDHDIRDSEFMKALHPKVIASSTVLVVVLFCFFSLLGLPVMFIYGIIRGLGQLPHVMILEIVGALLGRYYFQKKFGTQNFKRMAPTIMAGYLTGVGLIGMATVAMTLVSKAVSSAPF